MKSVKCIFSGILSLAVLLIASVFSSCSQGAEEASAEVKIDLQKFSSFAKEAFKNDGDNSYNEDDRNKYRFDLHYSYGDVSKVASQEFTINYNNTGAVQGNGESMVTDAVFRVGGLPYGSEVSFLMKVYAKERQTSDEPGEVSWPQFISPRTTVTVERKTPVALVLKYYSPELDEDLPQVSYTFSLPPDVEEGWYGIIYLYDVDGSSYLNTTSVSISEENRGSDGRMTFRSQQLSVGDSVYATLKLSSYDAETYTYSYYYGWAKATVKVDAQGSSIDFGELVQNEQDYTPSPVPVWVFPSPEEGVDYVLCKVGSMTENGTVGDQLFVKEFDHDSLGNYYLVLDSESVAAIGDKSVLALMVYGSENLDGDPVIKWTMEASFLDNFVYFVQGSLEPMH